MGKVVTLKDLQGAEWADRADRHTRKVVLTNGCFDVLTPAHFDLLKFAAGVGDILIVAVNSDEAVRALKGPNRPINSQADRAAALAMIAGVDYVTIFGTRADPSVEPVVAALDPDILVKGGNYRVSEVVGRAFVERRGGRVVMSPHRPGVSTTRTLAQLETKAGEKGGPVLTLDGTRVGLLCVDREMHTGVETIDTTTHDTCDDRRTWELGQRRWDFWFEPDLPADWPIGARDFSAQPGRWQSTGPGVTLDISGTYIVKETSALPRLCRVCVHGRFGPLAADNGVVAPPAQRAVTPERPGDLDWLVLVDMDGLLVDFPGEIIRRLCPEKSYADFRGDYDIGRALGLPTDLYSMVGPDFWESCPWMADGRAIWEAILETAGPERVVLCSSPTHESSSPMGKLRWIEHHLGEQWLRRYIFTPCKWACASARTILIDDCEEQVDAFDAAGGQSILVPRPWNSLWARTFSRPAPDRVQEALARIVQGSDDA